MHHQIATRPTPTSPSRYVITAILVDCVSSSSANDTPVRVVQVLPSSYALETAGLDFQISWLSSEDEINIRVAE
ncbi:hypothetical protein NMY22_g10839 [Coprinellus aureogranulatus]|nr:hypothetical protein NMY22_g10839 [Coprinellus aureogranulatus]